MKLNKGDVIETLALPSTQGDTFDIKDLAGKKAIVTFYRFATCPFCNLRINEFTKRYSELGDNFQVIAIFDSPLDFLIKSSKKHNAPFKILADENFEYFKKYEIERSVSKTINAILFKAHKIIPAMLKGYIPTRIKGHLDIAVTDVLINEQGVVEEVYYAQKDIADHFKFEKIKEFALS